MKATKGRGDSNGNGQSIPCGIHKPEENFGRASERFAGMELCSFPAAEQAGAVFLRGAIPFS
jgi:hypothetical protein